MSSVTQAVRELFGNTDLSVSVSGAWSMQHPVLDTLIWIAAILAVLVPLSVSRFQRTSR